jgi:hypothetical protein
LGNGGRRCFLLLSDICLDRHSPWVLRRCRGDAGTRRRSSLNSCQ